MKEEFLKASDDYLLSLSIYDIDKMLLYLAFFMKKKAINA